MALTDRPGVLIALAAVLVIAYLMWSLMRKAAPQATATSVAASQADADQLLLRFVTDEQGARLGETVALEGDRVILKVRDGFVSVPAAKIKTGGAMLQLDFGVDWDEAKRLGEAWRERSHKVISYADSELPKEEP